MTATPKAPKYLYRVRQEDYSHQYKNLFIDVCRPVNHEEDRYTTDSYQLDHAGITLKYQSDWKDFSSWYGGSVIINENRGSNIVEAYSEAVKLLKEVAIDGYIESPAAILAKLEKTGKQFFYDPRIDQNVEDLLPADFIAWKDDSGDNWYCKVLARDEQLAQWAINREFIRLLSESSYTKTQEAYAAWITAGRPVKPYQPYTYGRKSPDFRTAQQKLSGMPTATPSDSAHDSGQEG